MLSTTYMTNVCTWSEGVDHRILLREGLGIAQRLHIGRALGGARPLLLGVGGSDHRIGAVDPRSSLRGAIPELQCIDTPPCETHAVHIGRKQWRMQPCVRP